MAITRCSLLARYCLIVDTAEKDTATAKPALYTHTPISFCIASDLVTLVSSQFWVSLSTLSNDYNLPKHLSFTFGEESVLSSDEATISFDPMRSPETTEMLYVSLKLLQTSNSTKT